MRARFIQSRVVELLVACILTFSLVLSSKHFTEISEINHSFLGPFFFQKLIFLLSVNIKERFENRLKMKFFDVFLSEGIENAVIKLSEFHIADLFSIDLEKFFFAFSETIGWFFFKFLVLFKVVKECFFS